jgi:hypothetical protein
VQNSITLLVVSAAVVLSIGTATADEASRYAISCDQDTGLCWQNPQKDAYKPTVKGLNAAQAGQYCNELVLGGHDDWRLPDTDELRALISGHAATATGGICKLSVGGVQNEPLYRACQGGAPLQGPNNGCYWKPWLTGTCDRPDPPKGAQYLETWASNRPSDTPVGWVGYVSFDMASLGYNHEASYGDARCVREGDSGTEQLLLPENNYVPTAIKVAEQGPCDIADKVELKIIVPDKLDAVPNRLMAFFYNDNKWQFPPAGPPDGGTDANVVLKPVLDEDNAYTMVLPACTYYKERALRGNYRIYVQLLTEKRIPPMPGAGDYFWGSNTEVFSLPFDGESHDNQIITRELTLWPVIQ